MVYFTMTDLIGRINSKETYLYYLHIIQWCETNLLKDSWHLDYSSLLCINGINIPCGLTIVTFKDAIDFVYFN